MMNQQSSGFFSSIPAITKNLIIINVLCWIASLVFQRINIDFFRLFALHYPASDDFNPIQFVTYMFLHDSRSISHLFFNMFGVYMFGRVLENIWGPKRFLIYYMVTGLGAALVNILVAYLRIRAVESSLSPEMIEQVYQQGGALLREGMSFGNPAMASLNALINVETVGASGAVFGILLAFGVLFPNAPLYIMFIPVPVKAKYFVIGYGLIELFFGFAGFSGDNVAHFAHLGGMIFGYILIYYWKKKDAGNGHYFY
ncbi:MAG: rhomboid family intramembrane serine protease [Tannerellaceae bacterium]|jgi:membrane associated rhomboid family serine protease|nr:rhomboid family intramembrane serine protease [Tannerellaceae bacterium]